LGIYWWKSQYLKLAILEGGQYSHYFYWMVLSDTNEFR
jgi:hypothetical protein